MEIPKEMTGLFNNNTNDRTKKYINENQSRFIDELIEILKIPSISADPKYKNDVLYCADVDFLKNQGADNIEICETSGYLLFMQTK